VTSDRGVALFARTIRGIESVVAGEIAAGPGAAIERIGHREVTFRLPVLGPEVLNIRTADDIFLSAGVVTGIDHTRASLARLARAVGQLDLRELAERRAAVLPLSAGSASSAGAASFDVAASFLGRRNYNRTEIEDSVGPAIAPSAGGRYISRRVTQRPVTSSTWRVHISDGEALIGLRVGEHPLHRRAYKTTSQPGTLHPPLAAALALLGGLRSEGLLADPFCGVGTIPIEASALSHGGWFAGLDISPGAVTLAGANARSGRACNVAFTVADAGRLPLPDAVVDRVVTNPPWGRALEMGGATARGEQSFWRECARVLGAGGRAAVLMEDADGRSGAWQEAGLRPVLRLPVSVFGAHPEITVLVRDDDTAEPVDRQGLFGRYMASQLDRSSPGGESI
jgi:tRNA (guanine6-N2)-methyltransferase